MKQIRIILISWLPQYHTEVEGKKLEAYTATTLDDEAIPMIAVGTSTLCHVVLPTEEKVSSPNMLEGTTILVKKEDYEEAIRPMVHEPQGGARAIVFYEFELKEPLPEPKKIILVRTCGPRTERHWDEVRRSKGNTLVFHALLEGVEEEQHLLVNMRDVEFSGYTPNDIPPRDVNIPMYASFIKLKTKEQDKDDLMDLYSMYHVDYVKSKKVGGTP